MALRGISKTLSLFGMYILSSSWAIRRPFRKCGEKERENVSGESGLSSELKELEANLLLRIARFQPRFRFSSLFLNHEPHSYDLFGVLKANKTSGEERMQVAVLCASEKR